MSAPAEPRGMVDVHCHVLPGVDDGSPDLATSLEFLRLAAAAGTSDIIATPHQHPGRYPNLPGPLIAAHARLLDAREDAVAAGEVLPRVHLGAEVHLEGELLARVEAGERLCLANGPYLLFELPDVFLLPAVEELIHGLLLAGVVPVLAHPERIGQIVRQPKLLERLVALGAYSQITAMSVTGDFGPECRALSERFLDEGLVHAVASDAHDPRRRRPTLRRAREVLQGNWGEAAARLLLDLNPRAMLEGRPLESLPRMPAPPEPPGLLSRLRQRFRPTTR